MAAVAHNPAFAAKVGVPQSVGREFNQADKGGALLHQSMMAEELRERGRKRVPRAERPEERAEGELK